MRRARLVALGLGLLLVASVKPATTQEIGGAPVPLPIITGTLLQGHQDSAVNTPDVVTLAAVAGQTIRLYSIVATCSAGNAIFTVESPAGTVIMDLHNNAVGTTPFIQNWYPGLTGAVGQAVVITLGTCGAGNTGHLSWQGGRR